MKNNLLRESNDIRRLMGLPLIMEQDNICASQDWYVDIEREGGANKLFVDKICKTGVPPAIDGEDEKNVFIKSVNDLPKEARKWIIDQIQSVYPDNHETTGLGDSLTLVSIGDEMIGGKFSDKDKTDMNEYYEFDNDITDYSSGIDAFKSANKDIKSHYNEPSFDEMKRKHSLDYDTDFDIDLTMLNEDYEIQRIRSLHENTKNRNGKLILERVYKLGSRGSQVEKIQQKLVDLGYNLGTTGPNGDGVDGQYGSKTYKAVRKFQEANPPLKVDGKVGDNTSPVLFGTGNVGDDNRRDDNTRQQPTPTGPVGPDTAPRGCPKTQSWYDRVKRMGLDRSVKARMGSSKKTICDCMLNTLPGCSGTSPVTDQPDPVVKSNIEISDVINPRFQLDIENNAEKLEDGKQLEYMCSPDSTNCAQFINNISDDISYVGSAWDAYANTSNLGQTIYSAFKGQKQHKDLAIRLWKQMQKAGGIKDENDKISYRPLAKTFVNNIVPKTYSGPELQLDDTVGIFWPGSEHHHEAFYQGAKAGGGWFKNCNPRTTSGCDAAVPGNTLGRGDLWGMNTHVGRVLIEKDGKPFILHNVGGNVKATPAEDLRIAWVARK